MADTTVSCQGVTYAYGSRRALDGVTFDVAGGEIFGVLGPNGSGKTTLFRLLSTLVPLLAPNASGSVALAGNAYPAQVDGARRRLGVVFQSPSLDKKLTVQENIDAHGHLYGLRGAELKARVDDLLARFALDSRRNDLVETLSGGLQRRVEVAKSLVPRPAVLLLDEPSTGLDPTARRELWNYLRALRDSENLTILMTTHFLDEAEWCDRLLILDEGKQVALDTPEALKRRVGGALLTLQSDKPDALREAVRAELGIEASARGVFLDLPVPEDAGAERDLVGRVLARFRGEISGLTLSAPSLENVFTRLTGRAFVTGGGEEPAPKPAKGKKAK
jgi:ABC-2 type transport system ATP-binding protein